MFPSVDDPKNLFFVLLELSQEELERQAENLEYEMRTIDNPLMYKFIKDTKHLYEPFRTRERQEIMMEILKKVINLEELMRNKVLISHFFMHDMNA